MKEDYNDYSLGSLKEYLFKYTDPDVLEEYMQYVYRERRERQRLEDFARRLKKRP